MLSDEVLRNLKDISVDARTMRPAIKHALDIGFQIKALSARGTFNRCFYVTKTHGTVDHVARVNVHPSPSAQALHLEQWVNNEAIARAFPTPRIVHVDTSCQHCPYPFQLIEWVGGVSLRSADEATVRKVLGQLGAALARLHGSPVSTDRWGRVGLGTYPEWDLFWMANMDSDAHDLLDLGLITDDQFDQVYAIGDSDARYWGVEGAALLHGDLSYDNILLDPKTNDLQSVIDWEDAVLGDPIFELAGLATFHPEARHSAFLDAYYGGAYRPPEFDVRFWTYYLRISLAKAVHRHRFGYPAPERRADHQHPDDRIALALSHLKDL